MAIIDEKIHIDRPVEEVFAFAVDPANQTTIQSNLVEFNSDPPAKGVKFSGVTSVAGKKVEWTSEFTEFVRNERVEIQSIKAPMDFHIIWIYSESDGGTDVHFHQEAGSFGGFFGKVADPLVTRMYARDVRANLANMKDLLES